MAKFADMLESYTDEELGAKMRDRFTRLTDAHAKGIADEHPYAQWNRENATLRAHRAANDNGLEGADPSTPSKGGPSASTLETPASRATHDAALKAHERHVADAEQTRETEEFIPSYGRL